jgi:hypothetical protein
MVIQGMIAAVEQEIARLELVRKLLSGESSVGSNGTGTGSHKAAKPAARAKRVLTAEAKERIASAQRKRWAAVKKAEKKAARQ